MKLAVATLVLLAVGAFGTAWYVRSRLATPYEQAGLDIVEHGMYGYPEQFIHLEAQHPVHANGSREAVEAPR